ncbi:arginine-binding periplasmic protein [Legionella birminghamensis]|uniref:Arginine-binding periplasmic protein n=1 Tax=Legionella birminghamensis TaxID=28083 RepID=A0A378II50_9GAMM|nr:transporter substrate-binding domain-containing protein [Legionella birminghamensis]KTC75195.1 arginine-binding periplasmic protein [Legionella birminghamensis]STX31854.1 arginine-binding periplasmic protein [Legionella birminghamensis]
MNIPSLRNLLIILFFCFSIPAQAVIKVGTVFFYPPFVLSLNEGFDIQLMQSLCQGLKEKCQIIPMDFNKLYTSLDKGQIDLAIGGIAISPQRKNDYIFSLPYMLSRGQFLILKGAKVNSIEDLKGATIGVIKGDPKGGVFYDYLENNFEDYFQVQTFDDIEDVITALSNNNIKAAFLHHSTALYWEQNGGGQFQTFGKVIPLGEGYAIMALPSNAALIQRINALLQGMEKDNAYLNLYNTYFGN